MTETIEVHYIKKQTKVMKYRIIKRVQQYEDTKATNHTHWWHEDKLVPELVF